MKQVSFLLLFVSALLLASCDNNSTNPSNDYIHPKFVQPTEGQIITDSTYRLIVDADQNCGCTSYTEFYIDDTLVYTDYIREFDYLMNCADWQGKRTIMAHSVVPGKAEGYDSVHVTIDLSK